MAPFLSASLLVLVAVPPHAVLFRCSHFRVGSLRDGGVYACHCHALETDPVNSLSEQCPSLSDPTAFGLRILFRLSIDRNHYHWF